MVKKQAQNALFTKEFVAATRPLTAFSCRRSYNLMDTNKRPVGGRLLAVGLGLLKGYVAVAAYHVDLSRGANDGSAMRADVLDTAVFAGAASALDGRGRFAAFVIVGLGFDLEHRFAAGGYILHAGLLGQPCGSFLGQRRNCPAIGGVMLNVQAVCLSRFFEFLVVVVPVVADVLDLMGQVVEMRHFVEHGRCHLADRPVDVLGAYVDFPICLAAGLPDFIYAAPAVGSAPAVRRYGDGRAGKLVIIEVMVEKVEHGLGLGYDFRYAQHCCGLPCFDVVTAYPFEHIFQDRKRDKEASCSTDFFVHFSSFYAYNY